MCYITLRAEKVIPAPIENTFEAYHELTNHPIWSSSVKNVEWVDEKSEISSWNVKLFGSKFHYTAINHTVKKPNTIQWKTLSGDIEANGNIDMHDVDRKNTRINLELNVKVNKTVALFSQVPGVHSILQRSMNSDLNSFSNHISKFELKSRK